MRYQAMRNKRCVDEQSGKVRKKDALRQRKWVTEEHKKMYEPAGFKDESAPKGYNEKNYYLVKSMSAGIYTTIVL